MEKKYDFQKAEKALEKMWQENDIYRYQNGKERKIFSSLTSVIDHMVGMDREKRSSAAHRNHPQIFIILCRIILCKLYYKSRNKQELSAKLLDTNRHLPTYGNRLDILQKVLEIGGEMCYHNNHV